MKKEKLKQEHLPIEVNGVTISESDLPSDITFPVYPNEISWGNDLLSDSKIKTVTGKVFDSPTQSDKENWLNDSIQRHLNLQYRPPSGGEAYDQIRTYLKDNYTLDEWMDLVDDNPTLIESIKNENYEAVSARLDTLVDRGEITTSDRDEINSILKQ